MDIGPLAVALTSSLTAGLNLYITILTLGLIQRFDLLTLPPAMAPLSNTWVLVVAAILFLIEFVADKIPYIDNLWDSIHTFIRVPAGAYLAASSLSQAHPQWVWIAALLGGFVTFSAHGAKASARLAVNSTPEPFTNWFLSLSEDVVSLGLLWLVSSYPYLAMLLGVLILLCFLTICYLFWRFLKTIFRRNPSGQPAG